MKPYRTIVAGILAVSAVFFGIAHAKGTGCESDGSPGFRNSSIEPGGRIDPKARLEKRLERLKGELKLTVQQESLWQAYADKSVSEADKAMQAMRESMQDNTQLNAPERMAQMQNIMQQRLTAMASANDSFKRLYTALTPEQKAAADKHFSAAGRHKQRAGRDGPRRDRQGAPNEAESRKS